MPRTHPLPRDCPHEQTVTVISGGVERVICETCGQVTVRYESVISRDISRAQFGRKAELPHDNGGNGRHEREDSGISPVTRSA